MWLDDLRRDLAYATRWLVRNPAFAGAAILTLALGIGANTAIFSLTNALMLRPLPVRAPHQLVELLSANYPGDPRLNMFSLRVYEHFRDQNQVFADLIGVAPKRLSLTADGTDAQAVDAEIVVGNFFEALGLQPAIGRLIEPSDDVPSAEPAAVVSWSLWQERFRGEPSVLGRPIVVDGLAATIVGVAPRSFRGVQVGARPQVWLPVAVQRQGGALSLIGRLKTGISIEQAQAEMRVLDRWRIEENERAANDPLWRQVRLDLEPASAGLSPLREQFKTPLLALGATVFVLLLLACLNVASMLAARGEARRREMALRVAIGAGRARLIRQAVAESLLLAAAAGVLGVAAAYAGANALVRIVVSGRDIRLFSPGGLDIGVGPDLRVLLFAAGITTFTAVLFGTVPVLTASLVSPVTSLRFAGVAGDSRSGRTFRKTLIVAQVAVSMLLVWVASLFSGHLSSLRNRELGFDRASILLVTLDWGRAGEKRTQWLGLYQDLTAKLESIPGIQSATLSGMSPISGAAGSRFATVPGFVEPPDARRRLAINSVAPKYFRTLGTPILAGRDFQFEDQGRPRVAIVNAAMARYYFGSGTAVGRQLLFEGDTVPYEIIGVVGDAKYLDLREPPPRTVYLNAVQDRRNVFSQLSVRTVGAPASVAAEVRRAVSDVLGSVPISGMTTMAAQMDASIVPERLIALVAGLFGVLGALLAAIGLYGLMAFTVARRTSELGVRIALGATRREIGRTVFASALWLVLSGVAIAAPLTFWSQRAAASVVANLGAGGAASFAIASAVMVGVGLIAAYIPARRAMKVDPLQALRAE